MPRFENARQLLRAIDERLDGWVHEARSAAYSERFEGPDAALSDEELARLDRVDSRLSREHGEGLWGEDAYAVVPAGAIEEESTPHVVCTYYPQIPEYVLRGDAWIDEEERRRFNRALWEYAERVLELVQAELESFVWSSEVETWAG